MLSINTSSLKSLAKEMIFQSLQYSQMPSKSPWTTPENGEALDDEIGNVKHWPLKKVEGQDELDMMWWMQL